MKRMISACLRFEAPDLWLAVPAALFPVLVSEVTALLAATEDDPEALVLLPGVGMILTVVLCCVLGGVYLCSNFPLLLQFSASRRGSLAGLCLHILRMTVLAEVIAAAAIMALGAVSHGFFPQFAVGELWHCIPVFVWPVCAVRHAGAGCQSRPSSHRTCRTMRQSQPTAARSDGRRLCKAEGSSSTIQPGFGIF